MIYEPQPVFDFGSNLGEGELSSRKLVIMFYFHHLLSKKHPMGQIWIAATVRLSINRKKAAKINIEQICHFNIGAFMEKGLSMAAGQTPVQKYWPTLFRLVQSGELDPTIVITHVLGLGDAPDAYTHFNAKEEEWIKVLLKPEIDLDVITTEGPGLKERARNLVSGAVAGTINTVQKATGAVTSATSGTSTDVHKA
ncbi:hypothetical protein KC19_VG337800 [Ceratodon purpureus]|uniref:Rad21/Rec8-like protein N-terminal domain-containing protein n=1 Tax=Ceratodon purpureus TaxID=3225 RepID=A0A8T0HWA4_CERPU|nr:hypothetical protein KC19_VG337800 [Ceratodon purpureus]